MTSRLAAEAAGFLTATALAAIALVLAGRHLPDPAAATVLTSMEPYLDWGLLVLAAAFALAGRFWRAIASALVAVAFLFTFHTALAPYRIPENGQKAPDSAISLISFNILNDNWDNAARIADFLAGSGTDLAVILEPVAIASQLEHLQASFPYRTGCNADGTACSLLVLSRHPLADATVASLSPVSSYKGRLVTARITIGGQPVTLVAVHFTKPFFGPAQRQEFRHLADRIARIPGPVIVAGDFNAPAWAPGFIAFLEATGLRLPAADPATWPVWLGDFGIPIDHVLVRGDTGYFRAQAIADPMGSNHRGLKAAIGIPEPGR